jgi:hypothetical protein
MPTQKNRKILSYMLRQTYKPPAAQGEPKHKRTQQADGEPSSKRGQRIYHVTDEDVIGAADGGDGKTGGSTDGGGRGRCGGKKGEHERSPLDEISKNIVETGRE